MTPESDTVPDRDLYLLAQMREAFGRVVYSHKTHEKQADICFTEHRWQQGVLIVLTAISSGTFLAAVVGLLGSAVLTSLATSSIALLVSWMSLGTKTFKFEEESEAHRGIDSRLWDIRESYISLITDVMSGTVSNAEGRERRDELQQAVRDASPTRPGRAAGQGSVRPRHDLHPPARYPVELRGGHGRLRAAAAARGRDALHVSSLGTALPWGLSPPLTGRVTRSRMREQPVPSFSRLGGVS